MEKGPDFVRYNVLSSQSGFSIVATVMIMMILALFAAAAVSLITTATGTGIQEERGVEAFYIADGGMQYTLKLNTYPYYAVSTTTLGNGSFTVSVPRINSLLDVGTTDTSITVSSTEGFTTAPDGNYWTLLCSTASGAIRMTSDCEKMSFTTKGSSSFSSGTRGRDSTDAATHPVDAVVMMYSWDTAKNTTLARDLAKGAKCKNAASRICVANTAGFATTGFIRVHYDNGNNNNNEDIFYDGVCSSTGAGCTVDLITDCGSTCAGATAGCLGTVSCTRKVYDYDGTSNGTVNHLATTAIYQSEFSVLTTSTGRTPGAIILTDIKRVLQTNVLPLRDP